jgi:RNA polymerase sigma-70 factor (ECF subfamily)
LETSDREDVARVLAGDRDSFHGIVRRHAAPLWSTVRASVRSLEDAHEVFQETWVRALQRLDSLRDPGRLRAWLLSIALNLVRQEHRRQGVVAEAPGEVLDRFEDAAGVDPARAAAENELVDDLRARIAELPDRQREVLDLRLNHELSHGEIADLLGITPESSRANTYQALRKLRAALASETEDAPTGPET